MTWKMRAILAALFLLLSNPVYAQTHPCDGTVPNSYQIRRDQSAAVGFCHSQQDDEGGPIAIGAIRFRIINASTQAVIADLGLLAPLTGPNAAGLYYFQSPARTFAADVNIAVSAEFNQIVVPSTAIFLDVRGGPKAPVGTRVVISQ